MSTHVGSVTPPLRFSSLQYPRSARSAQRYPEITTMVRRKSRWLAMGWFGNLIGSADSSVIQNGILGRGEITNLQMSGMTLQSGNGLVERKCTITANVFLDNTP